MSFPHAGIVRPHHRYARVGRRSHLIRHVVLLWEDWGQPTPIGHWMCGGNAIRRFTIEPEPSAELCRRCSP